MLLEQCLSICSLTDDILMKLDEHDIKTVEELLLTKPSFIASKTEVKLNVIEKIITELEQLFSAQPKTALQVYNHIIDNNINFLSIGSEEMDKELLFGGMKIGQLIELVGNTGSGKTQICLNCALQTLVNNEEANVIYIDTGNSFSSSRIVEMFNSQNFERLLNSEQTSNNEMKDEDFEGNFQNNNNNEIVEKEQIINVIMKDYLPQTLSRLKVLKIYDAFQLLDLLESLHNDIKNTNILASEWNNTKLIIIDSLAAILSPIIGGQSYGHSIMIQITKYLKAIANEHELVVLYTNNTVRNKNQVIDYISDKDVKPALGYTFTYVPNYRIFLHYDIHNNKRYASSNKSTKRVFFDIHPTIF
eukprot:TRINITY_DN368_c1_g2_i1.p1 TRINITY_DN368_c1_g2~~TRINITY_DN368_c1_g2_i1.p1  ORF type:complete len:360 (-),score=81.54 TRINITY_DN368_c1_g2_i1:77-1156(-)